MEVGPPLILLFYLFNLLIMEFYHTYNRGVEKREIFLDKKDYFRAIHDLYEFNDADAVLNVKQRTIKNGGPTSINRKPRKILIDLFCWCLMPNHYHFFSRPRTQNGIPKFHQKFGTGFTGYFNLRYTRNGVLFQGGYKKVLVINDAQAGHLVCYIHSNPLELWKPNWKEKGLKRSEIYDALEFLKSYRYSSHLDSLGIKNFPSLINNEFLEKFFGSPSNYEKYFIDWLKQYQKNIKFIHKFIIEKD